MVAKDLSPTSRLRQKMKKVTSNNIQQQESKLRKEFFTYENMPSFSGYDVLNWWKSHKEMLPILSKLAQLYLSIPATSAQSERVFSAYGRVFSSSRTSLEPRKVEGLVVINKNKILLKEYKQVNKL